MIRHAVAGERGNDITTFGNGVGGNEQYKMASYNRTKKSFNVLLYLSGGAGTGFVEVSIPSTIQDGKYYNNEFSKTDFRGEGFKDGSKYQVRVVTKDINRSTGADENVSVQGSKESVVANGKLTFRVGAARKFTTLEFLPLD